MKIKDGFILREVAGSYIVVAVGEAVKVCKGIINLNETGAFLWKLFEKGCEKEDAVKELLSVYEVDEKTAREDVDKFVSKLISENLMK